MIVYQGRVFSVEVERARFPNGRELEMDIVRHPASVVLLPMQDDDHVILIRQYRHSIRREIWELPAGSVDAGESAEAAAARECEEEIALVPERVQRIAGLYPTPGYCDEEMIYFRVSGLHPPAPDSPHKSDEDEDIYVQVFTIVEARALVTQGEIVDLKTAYGLTLI
jgi:8-oxo-dGTP pyrophosphatase MutT (NUDIX family)